MINNEILSFIKDQLAQGTTKPQVKDMLVTQGGWDEKDVEEAFETINFSGTSYPDVLKNAEVLAVKKDAEEEKNKNVGAPVSAVSPVVGGGFSSAADLMKSAAGDTHSATFSPGLSHKEQPKVMNPSAPAAFSPVDIAPPSRMVTPSSEAPRMSSMSSAGGSNALGDLRSRISSGVSSVGIAPEPASVFQPATTPMMKEPVAPTPMQRPFVAASNVATPNIISPRTAAVPFGMEQESSAPFPALNKTPIPSVMTSAPQPLQPISVFPKGPINMMSNARVSPTPAQLATMKSQKGGGFFRALMLFIIGLVLGGILMNAYMNDYIHTDAVKGLIDKGMNMIGLGTVTAPAPDAPAPVVPAP